MRLQFTIRDFVWLLLLIAMAVGWGVDRFWHGLIDKENQRLTTDYAYMQQYNNQIRPEIDQLKIDVEALKKSVSQLESAKK